MSSIISDQSIISKKSFLLEDQFIFARFSGDKNPIHLDKIASRRTIHGQCIVHGMHSLLWALNSLAKEKNITGSKIIVRFLKPIFLGEEVSCVWDKSSNRLYIITNEIINTAIDLEIDEITPNNEIQTPIKKTPRSIPLEPTFLECSKLSNQPFNLFGTTRLSTRLFPYFCNLYGAATACEIAAISQIVGMECPGLHSLFAGLEIKIAAERTETFFEVTKSDERFNLLNIYVKGNSLTANIESFFRPMPSKNLHISQLKSLVKNNEFKNVNALIIGGSRGLGEVVAKLISLGGGKSLITYHVGYVEAERVVNEIQVWGGESKMTQLTVNEKDFQHIDYSNINQIYYFASPKILSERSKNFDEILLSLTEKYM